MLLIFQAIRMCTRTSLNEELSRTPAEETSIHSLGKVKEVPNLDHDTLQLLCNAAGLPPEGSAGLTLLDSSYWHSSPPNDVARITYKHCWSSSMRCCLLFGKGWRYRLMLCRKSLQFVQQMIQNLPMGSFRNTVGQTGSHSIGQTLSVNHWCISCVLTLRFQAISSTMVLTEYVIITTTDGVLNILFTKVHLHTFSSEQ